MEQLRNFKIEISNAHIGSRRHHNHHNHHKKHHNHQHHHDKSSINDNAFSLLTRRSSSVNQLKSSKDSHRSGF
jgi:hypothetical protein